MSVKNIYIIRHGETDYNKKGFLQGASIDSNLNEKGRQQADSFFKHYQDVPFDKIYTSVLKRSIQSVEKFINKGIQVEHFKELNEINWGEMEGKQLNPFSWIKLRRIVKKWKEGHTNKKIPEGESPDEVAIRMKIIVNLILSRTEEKNVLICMHGRAMRVLLCLLTHTKLQSMDNFNHENLGLYLLSYPEQDSNPQIVMNNSKLHLNIVKDINI